MEFSKTFKDSLGRKWTVDLTVGAARRMNDIAGASLDDLVPPAPKKGEKPDPDGMKPLVTFLSDPFKVFDVFYTLVKPQADTLALTKEQVEEGIDSVAAEAMGLAVLRAIHDFFRWDPARQAMLRQIAKIGNLAMSEAAKKIDAAMSKIDFGKVLAEQPEIDVDVITAELTSRLSKPASATQATSASTPTP